MVVPTVSSSWCSLLSSRMWAPEGHDERIITYSDSKLNGFENFLFLQLIIIKKKINNKKKKLKNSYKSDSYKSINTFK